MSFTSDGIGVYDLNSGVFILNENGFPVVRYDNWITNGNQYNSVSIWAGIPSGPTFLEDVAVLESPVCCAVSLPDRMPVPDAGVPEPSYALIVALLLLCMMLHAGMSMWRRRT